jgi:hypothetical protein
LCTHLSGRAASIFRKITLEMDALLSVCTIGELKSWHITITIMKGLWVQFKWLTHFQASVSLWTGLVAVWSRQECCQMMCWSDHPNPRETERHHHPHLDLCAEIQSLERHAIGSVPRHNETVTYLWNLGPTCILVSCIASSPRYSYIFDVTCRFTFVSWMINVNHSSLFSLSCMLICIWCTGHFSEWSQPQQSRSWLWETQSRLLLTSVPVSL